MTSKFQTKFATTIILIMVTLAISYEIRSIKEYLNTTSKINFFILFTQRRVSDHEVTNNGANLPNCFQVIRWDEQKRYTNSLLNADSFYANFTDTNFQKIPIPHLTLPGPAFFWVSHGQGGGLI